MSVELRYGDLKPYCVVESLSELAGPYAGFVTLPVTPRWVPGERRYNVSELTEAQIVYQAVLAEGTKEDIKRYLNKNRLIELWPILNLDRRIVATWEKKFNALQGNWWSTKTARTTVEVGRPYNEG